MALSKGTEHTYGLVYNHGKGDYEKERLVTYKMKERKKKGLVYILLVRETRLVYMIYVVSELYIICV